jgi:CheY-like chemotaxis protein
MAHRNGLRLLTQVNTLLEFSRDQDASRALRPEPVDLPVLTCELAALFQGAVEQAGLRLVLDCPPLPKPVWVERDMWETVILNLLSNAFKFTLDGEITVTVDARGDQVRVRVSDTGAGIPEAELPHLFDRFYRVAATQARSEEGSGIGLSLVRDLIERHDGTITVTSTVGAGSTFTVLLPFGEPSPAADLQAATPPARGRPAGYVQEALGWVAGAPDHDADGPPEVLIVDDNADMRAHLTRALAPHWRVRAVHDGRDALETIRRQAPELVLTDVMMPRLDGFGLLRELRSDEVTRDIPVVMVSARAGAEAAIGGLDAGADDYLIKPFTTAELIARVRTQLRTARQRRQAATRIQTLSDITRQLNTSLDPEQISQTLTRHLVPAYAGTCSIRLDDNARKTRSPSTDDRLMLPMTSRGRPIGTVTLTGLTPAALHPAELPFLTELTSRAAVALDNASRYQHERATAMYLQAAMLSDLPDIPGLETAALYRPAASDDLAAWTGSKTPGLSPGPTPGTPRPCSATQTGASSSSTTTTRCSTRASPTFPAPSATVSSLPALLSCSTPTGSPTGPAPSSSATSNAPPSFWLPTRISPLSGCCKPSRRSPTPIPLTTSPCSPYVSPVCSPA